MNILDLERQQGANHVWVLNNMQNLAGKLGGNIAFTLQVDGVPRTLTIPETWLPIDLNTMVPKKDLINSQDFRSLLRKKWVLLISDEEAEEKFEEDGAVEEQERLDNLASSFSAEQSMNAVSGPDAERIAPRNEAGEWDKQNGETVETANAQDIGLVVLEEVIANIKEGVLTEADALNKLRILHVSRLSKGGLYKLYKELKSEAPKVSNWALKKAEELGFKKS